MRFVSTRGRCPARSFTGAVADGLAPDGGLYVPEAFPEVGSRLAGWEGLGYAGLAAAFLRLFAEGEEDPGEEEWGEMAARAYAGFDAPAVAPLVELAPGLRVLELFHGPTLAFKDFALQLLGLLYRRQVARTGRGLAVLGATSGDTGSAAIHGCLGQPGVRIFILYPEGRVAPLQERQMACTGAANVFAIPVPGTFDDAQRVVKEVFGHTEWARAANLAAVNSINISRVLAQCVYYLWAWLRLMPAERARGVEFVVPTGNFGNVLAGWMLRRMGVPGLRFVVATNRNDILHRFFAAADYSVGGVAPSLAPSMDIQAASNFERYLYLRLGGDAAQVRAVLADLREAGRLPAGLGPREEDGLTSTTLDDAGIRAATAEVFRRYGYTVCPHTACAFARGAEPPPADGPVRVVLATAHPAKFPETVAAATGVEPRHPSLEALRHRPLVRHPLPAEAAAIQAFIAAAGGSTGS